MKKTRILTLCECAILLALSTVLSMIPLPWKMPFGGSVTIMSMLPICMVCFRHGIKWGFFTSFVYSVIQLMLSIGEIMAWGLTPVVLIACIFLDYIFAYTSLGICGFFNRGKNVKTQHIFLCVGVAVAITTRFLCHYISGITLWTESAAGSGHSAYVFSLLYNGTYMLPELILTLIGANILLAAPQMRKFFVKK